MLKRFSHTLRLYRKKFRRKIKQCIYRFLVAIHEGEIRISFFFVVCTLFVLFLCVGFFFRSDIKKETPTTASVFGSELTHALRHGAEQNRRTDLEADLTLFLLPDIEDADALSSFLDSPLYGFYLTGKEVSFLPEFAASLSDSFVAGTPYVGGLSFSYNPKRFLYNRATDITLFTEEGTYLPVADDALYYVIGTESVFRMFEYLSERTFHLINIRPKDATGFAVSQYSDLVLRGADGPYTISDIYGNYLSASSSGHEKENAGEVYLCTSINTAMLFSQLNIAGYFLIGCTFLFLVLAASVRAPLRRTFIWFRIFLFHQKKRGKASLRRRIYTARTARRHAA